ncbi:MAG: cupredoxin domain-containing protein [Nitrospirota bacterium]|nr:cupredoxin domain-containing protein [Nitrospirota bacterium]
MSPSMISFIALFGWILALNLTFFGTRGPDISLGATSASLPPATDVQETEVIISIKSREFSPNMVSLTVGQKTRLVLKNLDTELHAFLPVALLTDIHLNLSGNGAPQFSKEGLVRVLLPTRGQTEIVFTPSRPGTFPYFCDLPGHVMRGTIMVHKNEGMIE